MQFHHFNQSAYYNAVQQSVGLGSGQAVFDFAKQNASFEYQNIIDYTDFLHFYAPNGYLGRKVSAIPVGFYHIIIEQVAKVPIAIIGILFNSVAGEKGDLKIYLKFLFFRTARELEFGFGSILTFFNDQLGCYYSQEAEFYLTCYKCWTYKNSLFIGQAGMPACNFVT